MTTPQRPVLVGVDGSPASAAAVELAVREAAWRRRPLRLVYADCWAHHPAWVDTDPVGEIADDLLSDPERTLRDAVAQARAAGAGDVRGEVVGGNPGAVLVRESAGAELLVVGHRGRGGFPGLLVGSIALTLVAHASCPVLVCRATEGPSDGDVLIGVDGSPAGDPAIGFAFEEARLRGVGLTAVHTWTGPTSEAPGEMLPLVYNPSSVEAREAELLDGALARWQVRFPEVPVRRVVTRSRAAGALVEASAKAQLVVVGAHGRGGRPPLTFGSVTHALLHHAGCPVASVRHGR